MPLSDADLTTMGGIQQKLMSTLTDEQKETNKTIRAEQMAEEKKAQTMEELTAGFQAADANGDGVLNLDEFKAFMSAFREGFNAKGGCLPDASAEDVATMFECHDRANPETAGVSLADWMANTIQLRQWAQSQK